MSEENVWIRTFNINGEERTDTTNRTPIIEHYTRIEENTYIDIGAGDGYESRALSLRGAKKTLAVEGKESIYQLARRAQDYLKLNNHEVKQLDVRKIDTFGLGKFDVVLCFGLLYHMTNPFNLLKRIKNITGELLLLETHIVPPEMEGLIKKHQYRFSFERHIVELDGIKFDGKIVEHLGDFKQTKGSLDSSWTFWLNIEALFEAILLAGFEITHFHYNPNESWPEKVRKTGMAVMFGEKNTKVFIVARPVDDQEVEVEEPSEKIIKGDVDWKDNFLQRIQRRML
ncbi:MAG: class I SAM-dependent methyltransferase, partial [Candidatus Auribacterota bacterium]|nr:class I SAM-dependent methyltransferase [Candidatus Auribacterota bacterium]